MRPASSRASLFASRFPALPPRCSPPVQPDACRCRESEPAAARAELASVEARGEPTLLATMLLTAATALSW